MKKLLPFIKQHASAIHKHLIKKDVYGNMTDDVKNMTPNVSMDGDEGKFPMFMFGDEPVGVLFSSKDNLPEEDDDGEVGSMKIYDKTIYYQSFTF